MTHNKVELLLRQLFLNDLKWNKNQIDDSFYIELQSGKLEISKSYTNQTSVFEFIIYDPVGPIIEHMTTDSLKTDTLTDSMRDLFIKVKREIYNVSDVIDDIIVEINSL